MIPAPIPLSKEALVTKR